MGLDMYVSDVDKRALRGAVTGRTLPSRLPEFHYWRKHHDFHGWMKRLYHEKGGEGEFNCDWVLLTKDDLARLASDLNARALPPTTGFFFGNNPPDDESRAADLEFVRKAMAALGAGRTLIYWSLW